MTAGQNTLDSFRSAYVPCDEPTTCLECNPMTAAIDSSKPLRPYDAGASRQ